MYSALDFSSFAEHALVIIKALYFKLNYLIINNYFGNFIPEKNIKIKKK